MAKFELKTNQEITNFLLEVYEIHNEAQSNYLCSRLLYENSYDNTKQPPYTNIQLVYLSISIHKLYIIQLDMLYWHKQEYSFLRFFNGLYNVDAVALGYTTTEINKWRSKLKTAKKIIDNVHKLRNNLYAHKTELANECKTISTIFSDLDKLFEVGEEIIVEAYKIMGTNIQMNYWYNENQFILDLQTLISDKI